jgi:hypothetical protein
MRTIIGIDPHKSSLTAVAVDDKGAVLGTRRVTVNKGTGTALLKWAAAFEDRRREGVGPKHLPDSGGQEPGRRRCSRDSVDEDQGSHDRRRPQDRPEDVRAVALAALHHQGLHRVAAEDQDSVLGLPPGWCGRPRHQGEGQRPDQSSSVTEEKPLGRGVTAPRCLPRCRLRPARLPRRLVLRVLPTSSGQEDDPVPKGLQPLTRGP